MPDESSFEYQKEIFAPLDLIYRAFTNSASLREWLCDISTTNPDVGGRIYLAWNRGYFASGAYTKLVPEKAVSFTWIGKEEPGWTDVDVTIQPLEGDDHYLVQLIHKGIGIGEKWENARDDINKGWEIGLENLKSTLEKGQDLRFTERPLIGIYPQDMSLVSEATKSEYQINVDYGVFVTSVLSDYGAEKAGIKANDVIVSIGNEMVKDTKSLAGIMSKYTAGDQILVDVYRGDEKLRFEINSKPQKIREIPETTEKLAKDYEAHVSELLESLEGILVGVSDAEASFTPGPEEWSIKEVLVHLIHTERDLHGWINDLVSGQERFYDEWPGNRLLRIRATLTTYPDVPSLIAELRRSFKETVASVAFLDERFTRRKTSYWRLGLDLVGTYEHFQEHLTQIEDNIKAVRASTQ